MCFCHIFLILFETMAECTCILHIGKPSKDTVKRFGDTSWAKVMAAKDVRMLSVKSKYSSLCTSLPETYSTSDGYHSSCYTNFTAVPKCQIGKNMFWSIPVYQSKLLETESEWWSNAMPAIGGNLRHLGVT